MQGDNYSGITHIGGDGYFPRAMHSCTRAHRQICVSVCLSVWRMCVYVCLYLSSFPPKGHFFQMETESSELSNESDCPAVVFIQGCYTILQLLFSCSPVQRLDARMSAFSRLNTSRQVNKVCPIYSASPNADFFLVFFWLFFCFSMLK